MDAFAGKSSKTVADQIDAFLYLGPQKALLTEPLPADIALDRAYRSEWLRRMKLVGLPGPSTLEEVDAQIVANAAHPMLTPAPRKPGFTRDEVEDEARLSEQKASYRKHSKVKVKKLLIVRGF